MNGEIRTETTGNIPLPEPESQTSIDVWEAGASNDKLVYYLVRHPWQWVMEDLATGLSNMKPVDTPSHLPLAMQQQQLLQQQMSAPVVGRSRAQRRNLKIASQGRASLRMEVVDKATGQVEFAMHGTSGCFEGLGDKDELVRTIQRCRCDHLHLSPPSILIQWDVTHEECFNVVGSTLPMIAKPSGSTATTTSTTSFAVLKEPMGSQGRGIFFVRNADEIHQIIDRNHKRAAEEPDFLENLIAVNGRIPSWVLQAEVYPSLLIRGRRKFHIRSYVVVVERPDDELLDMYVYSRHEVRIAGVPIDYDDDNSNHNGGAAGYSESGNTNDRNPLAHITNGALSNKTERVLLDQVQELVDLDIPQKVELFLAQIFAKHLLPDISRRVPQTMTMPGTPGSDLGAAAFTGMTTPPVRQFSLAGTDIMVTEDLRLYLLEVNVNPAAPPKAMCQESFSHHLHGFFRDLVNLVAMMGGLGDSEGDSSSRENFHDAFAILERQQQETTETEISS